MREKISVNNYNNMKRKHLFGKGMEMEEMLVRRRMKSVEGGRGTGKGESL